MNAGEKFWIEVAALLRGWGDGVIRRCAARDINALDTCKLAAGPQDLTHIVFAARSTVQALAICGSERRGDLVEALRALSRAAKATPVGSWRRGDPSDVTPYWLVD